MIGIPAWPHAKYTNQCWLAERKENPPFPNTKAVDFRFAPAKSADIALTRRCKLVYSIKNALAEATVEPSNVLE